MSRVSGKEHIHIVGKFYIYLILDYKYMCIYTYNTI
jgi:hypothetical protein